MANLLSALRLLLAPPFAYWMYDGNPWLCTLLVCAAIATDLVDGQLARRLGTESALGRALDHSADFLFVIAGLTAVALRGDLPWLLPALITLAFAQYVVDSYLLNRRLMLRMSALGRLNGIFYFVPLCGDILIRHGIGFLSGLNRAIAWALVLTTVVSIGDRWLASRRRSPDSPGAETADRSPH